MDAERAMQRWHTARQELLCFAFTLVNRQPQACGTVSHARKIRVDYTGLICPSCAEVIEPGDETKVGKMCLHKRCRNSKIHFKDSRSHRPVKALDISMERTVRAVVGPHLCGQPQARQGSHYTDSHSFVVSSLVSSERPMTGRVGQAPGV